MANVENSEPQEPREDTPEARAISEAMFKSVDAGSISLISEKCRIISAHTLSKTFRKYTKEELEKVLTSLKDLGVLSENTFMTSGGRPKQARYISPSWIIGEDQPSSELEGRLCDLLLEALKPPKYPNAVRVLTDTWCTVNGSMWVQKAGTVVESYNLVKWSYRQ